MSEVLHLTKPFSDRTLPVYRVSGRTLVVLRSFLKALGVPVSFEKKVDASFIFTVPTKNDARAVTLETCRSIIKQFCSKWTESDQKLAIDQLTTESIVDINTITLGSSDSSEIPPKKRDRTQMFVDSLFDNYKQDFILAFAPYANQREELDEANKKIKMLEKEVETLQKSLQLERNKRHQAEQAAIEKNPYNLATFRGFNKSQ